MGLSRGRPGRSSALSCGRKSTRLERWLLLHTSAVVFPLNATPRVESGIGLLKIHMMTEVSTSDPSRNQGLKGPWSPVGLTCWVEELLHVRLQRLAWRIRSSYLRGIYSLRFLHLAHQVSLYRTLRSPLRRLYHHLEGRTGVV